MIALVCTLIIAGAPAATSTAATSTPAAAPALPAAPAPSAPATAPKPATGKSTLPPPYDHLELLIRKHKLDEAQGELKPLLEKQPPEPLALYFAGALKLNGRDVDGAIALFDQGLALDDKNALLHVAHGGAVAMQAMRSGMLKAMGKIGDVKSEFERAVELDPRSVEARTALFQLLLMAPGILGGSTDKARLQAIEVSRLDPHAGALLHAELFENQDEHEKADGYVQKAFDNAHDDEERAEARAQGGMMKLQRKDFEGAIAALTQAIALQPLDADGPDLLARAQLEKGLVDEAIASEKRALALDPKHAPAFYFLGEAYAKKGLKSEAKAAYQQYLTLAPEGMRADKVKEKIAAL